jgi:hypothetical protein
MKYLTEEHLEHIFTYHDDPAAVVHYEAIRRAALAFARVVAAHTPYSADQATAIRKIREAVMTANAAVALKGRS